MQYTPNDQEQTSSGLKWNLAALLSYIPIVGLIFLFIEKQSAYVKYHAAQSTILSIAYIAAQLLLIIPILGWIVGPIISLVLFIFHIVSAINAWKGAWYRIPVLCTFTDKLVGAIK